ncbi:hypothetical protein ACOME3_000929 [Neoechinorhynchus agilis]
MCPENHVAYLDLSGVSLLKGVRQFPTNINAIIRDSDLDRVEGEGELVLFDANFTHIKRMVVLRLCPIDAITMEGVPAEFLTHLKADAFVMEDYVPQSRMDDFFIDTDVVCPMEVVARLDEPFTPLADGGWFNAFADFFKEFLFI